MTIMPLSQDHVPVQSCFGFGMNFPFWKDPKHLLACWKCRVGYWQGDGKGIKKKNFLKKGVNHWQAANILRMKHIVSEH